MNQLEKANGRNQVTEINNYVLKHNSSLFHQIFIISNKDESDYSSFQLHVHENSSGLLTKPSTNKSEKNHLEKHIFFYCSSL